MTRTTPALLALSLLIGCDEADDTAAETSPVSVEDLTVEGGCSDVTFTLDAADGTMSLVFQWSTDLAEQAVLTGTTQTATVDLSAEGALVLRQGTDVDGLECTDMFFESQVVDVEWSAISGTVALTVDTLELEGGYGMPATGTITVTDAVLTADGEEDVHISDITWSADIGWIEAG